VEGRWFDEVYRAHAESVFRVCRRFSGGDRDWAKDRMHDVFIKLLERADQVREVGDPGGWLYRVSVRTCFMELRRKRRFSGVLGALMGVSDEPSLGPERLARARRDVGELEAALADLPPKERAVVVLVHLEEKSQTEAAELLELSKGQVSKLHSRAMAKLRAREWDVA
jgi:RNA polymerase sigma-70 factor (ECF subfamily)